MKAFSRLLGVVILFLLSGCQPAPASMVTVVDGERMIEVSPGSRIPADIYVRAGLIAGPNDRSLYRGQAVPADQPLIESANSILQLRRAVPITIITPAGQRTLQTAAWTVGEALREAGLDLYAADTIDPPAETPLAGPMTINIRTSRELRITAGASSVRVRSSASAVGKALAEAGLPMLGMDFSRPAESEPLPADGLIRLVHVSESLMLAQKPVPFESELQASDQVPLDQQQVLNPGQPGLLVSRVRIRYEDGNEVSRQTESETLVRAPQKRIVGYGTKVEIKEAAVDGIQIQYWRAVQMFATAYSPCRSAPGQCYPSTASGKPVKRGVVALRTDLYMAMRGQPLYIPGYGRATVEDACGGCVGKPWIDLGYSDSDYQGWGRWVTVYFLTPVPSSIIYVLD